MSFAGKLSFFLLFIFRIDLDFESYRRNQSVIDSVTNFNRKEVFRFNLVSDLYTLKR